MEFAARDGSLVLVLGGDCTITLGVLAGLQRVEPDAGLVYFDGDADLSMPGAGSGILDAMGIAHLLGLAETGLTDLFDSGHRLPCNVWPCSATTRPIPSPTAGRSSTRVRT